MTDIPENIAQDKIYIYTKRRARGDGIPQFVELIPKLFGHLYMMDERYIKNFIEREKIKLNDKTLLEILTFYLETPNYINDIENVTDEDIQKIKDMNIEIFKESKIGNSNIMKEALIQHLFRGHEVMQYGIYFSIKYAKDDIDFISKFKQQSRPTPEDRIIMFTTLENLVNHVSTIKDQQKFKLPLLYVNPFWNYGTIVKKTIIFEENKQEFIENIKRTYDTIDKNDIIENNMNKNDNVEIICQIPLPNTLFKFFYVSDYKEFKQKYLKYKQKYLKLKVYNINN